MQRKTKLLTLEFGLLLAIFLVSLSNTQSTSAFSINITTSGPITTNVIPASDGSIGTSIVTDEVNITSNCRAGYTFTITGPSDSNLYLNGEDTNNASGTYFTPVDGTNALNSTNNTNKWGYTLASDASASTIFSPLSSTATILRTPAQTASPSSDIDTTIPIHYGAAVDGTMNPGSYTFANNGTITYAVTMDPSCLNYSVQYQGNNPDNPNGMGTTDESTGEKSVRQINISEGTTITLLAPNFKKQGYGFLGWSTDEDAYNHFTDNDNTNDPIIYGPMETVTIDSDIIATANTRNQINMYAVWLPALRTDPSDNTSTPVYFQDWDNPDTPLPHDGCSTLTQTVFDDTETNEKDKIKVSKDSVVALTDKRDNEVYTVAKLADGKCWMTENLRLDAEYTRGNNINDPTVTNQYLSQGYGGTTGTYGNFVGLADSENANFSNVTTSNSIYKSSANPPVDTYDPINQTLEDIGTTGEPSRRIPRYSNTNTVGYLINPTYTENYINPSSPSTSGTYKTSSIQSYGNYYTWSAAMANTNYYTNSSASESTGTSICPAGWYLPSSNGMAKEFGTLSQRHGGTGNNQSGASGSGDIMSKRFRSFPNNFLYSGDFDGSSANVRGSSGYCWSRTASDSITSHYIGLDSTHLYPSGRLNKHYGFSARCLIGNSDVEITLDSNNGTGAVSRVYGVAGGSVTLPMVNSAYGTQPSIAQLGYDLKNWNTAPDGSGTTYTTSYTIPEGSTGETLYAQWTPQYTITYVNNCQANASTNPSCTQTASDSTSVQRINLDDSGNGSGTLKASNTWTTMANWKISHWTTNADGTGTEYKVSTSYAVTGQSAGDSITLYAQWVPTYTIQYDGNGADNPNGMGKIGADGVRTVKQINVTEGDTIRLLASNFKKAGYGFVGWSTDSDAWIHFTDNDNTNNPTIYGPIETITSPVYPNDGTAIVTLYAVWAEAKKDNDDNIVYLQDFGTAECNNLTSARFDSETGEITAGDVVALTDKRDNEVYAVGRLADGNCWLMENLRIGHEGTVGNNINDPTITNQSLSQGYGGTPGKYGSFVGLAESETLGSSAANSIYESSSNPPVSTYDPIEGTLEDIGTADNPANRFPRYNDDNTKNLVDNPSFTRNYINSTSSTSTGNYPGSNLFSYGNYYTWTAAIANTNHYTGYNSTDDAGKDSENVGTSICPFGWHIPSASGPDKEYGFLSQSYGGTGNNQTNSANGGNTMSRRLRHFPNNYVYTNPRDQNGRYWGRSSWNSTNGYTFFLSDTNTSPVEHYAKSSRYSVRCLVSSS